MSDGDPSDRLLGALSQAEDTLSRLDARVAASALEDGWRARIACHEAVAWQWNEGETAPLAEVVLHDAKLGQEAPSSAVARTVDALKRRRRAGRRSAEDLGVWSGVLDLVGRRPVRAGVRSEATEALLVATAPRRTPRPEVAEAPSPPLPYLGLMVWPDCPFDEDEDVFGFWVARGRDFERYPALLKAAAALDLWTSVQPLMRETDVGGLIVEAHLRGARRLRRSPLLIESGRRILSRGSRYWNSAGSPVQRASYWLDAIAAGATFGMAQLDALSISRQRLDLALGQRRSTSRLPALADLLIRSPVVSASMVSEHLGVTAQGARTLLATLEGVIHEVTGRSSYRLWRL